MANNYVKMLAKDWNNFDNFSEKEDWGVASKMAYLFIGEIQVFRTYIKSRMVVTAGFAKKGHSRNSQHYKIPCHAGDFVLPDYKGHPTDLIIDALKFNFTGIGLYFNHKYKGKPVIGLHLDQRPLSVTEVTKTWLRNPDGEDIELNLANVSMWFKWFKKAISQDLPLKS